MELDDSINILGTTLTTCSDDPKTGFFRDGCCNTNDHDRGLHVVCVQVSADFLAYSKSQGNDLSTPVPRFGFPGLKPGDQWCLCAARWKEALDAGVAPPIFANATHIRALEIVEANDLIRNALDVN